VTTETLPSASVPAVRADAAPPAPPAAVVPPAPPAAVAPPAPPVIGLEIVGRGVYLRPHAPYRLTRLLFPYPDDGWHTFKSAETGEAYAVPKGYEVSESAPMPANQAQNKVTIEESFDRFEKSLHVDASVTVSNAMFSVDATAAQAKALRTSEDAYYALRDSFISFWAVYLSDTTVVPEDTFDTGDIPVPFLHVNRQKYEFFFNRYGTHFVSRVWVGGKASLAFTVLKSANISKEDVQAGIKASFGAAASGSVKTEMTQAKEKLQSSAECTVWGTGGDELKLAALSSFDEASYNQWLQSIKPNPQVVELEVAGIWTLVKDPDKAKALQDAYIAATTLEPLSAVFAIDRLVHFVRGPRYTVYNADKKETGKPWELKVDFPELAVAGFDRIDAGFNGGPFLHRGRESLARKIFMFHKDKYVRYDYDKKAVDEGYPRPIEDGFPGVTFKCLDAILAPGEGYIYFFRGKEYIRFNTTTWKADDGYPADSKKRWAGLTFDRLDAAIYWGNGKAYFFKDDQHIRYDMAIFEADPGYPKAIVGSYVEDWKFFD
jgi:hypothetical protein